MLVYLQSPKAAASGEGHERSAIEAAQTANATDPSANAGTPLDVLAKQEEQIHYALQLRKLTNGWTAPCVASTSIGS